MDLKLFSSLNLHMCAHTYMYMWVGGGGEDGGWVGSATLRPGEPSCLLNSGDIAGSLIMLPY